jgi:hypothetical protein
LMQQQQQKQQQGIVHNTSGQQKIISTFTNFLHHSGHAPTNRPYNGRSNIIDTNQQPQQQQSLDQHQVMATQSSNFNASTIAIKQRQNQQPTMNCDTNSTNSFLLSNNTTSDLSDNSQQCGNTSAITPSRRSKSSKKEKKSKKNNNKEIISGNNNNNFPSMTTFGGVISGNLSGNQQKPPINHHKLINDDIVGNNSVNNFFDGDTSNISNNPHLNDSKSKPSKPSSNRNMQQQPFLFNCDSLSSSQSISNFSFAGGRSSSNVVRPPANNDDKSLSFSGHFSKIKSNTTSTIFPQSQYPINVTTNTTAISLIEDDDVVLVNSSRSHSPFMNMTTIVASTDPTPLELLVKESMTPVTTNIVVPIVAAEPITKAAPKKRGRKKGSKGIDSQLHLQNSSSNIPSTSAGTGGHEINSYLDMKHKVEHMLPKNKKLKTTQELYAELQNKSKAASASTSAQVSPSSSSEQSLSTVVDSVASRMATPEPTSQDVVTPQEAKTSKISQTLRHNNLQQPVVEAAPPQSKDNIEDEIRRLMAQLPAIDFKAASDAIMDTVKSEEPDQCLCTMREIEPEIIIAEVVDEELVPVPEIDISKTVTPISTANDIVIKVAKKEVVEKPRIKPQKHVKSIFDLDYDDDNDSPIHDYRNMMPSQNTPQVDIVADNVVKEEDTVVKFEITVPAPIMSPPKLIPAEVDPSIPAPAENEPTNPIVFPPLVQIEYDIHPECPAMKKFETNPQKITNFHLCALHHRYIANVNGNWSSLPPTDSTIKSEESVIAAATVKEEKIETTTEDTLFDRVVPLYNFLHYEPIPKSHTGLIEPFNHHNIKLKLLKRELLYKKEKEELQIREKKRRKNLRREARKNNIISDDKSQKVVSRKRKFNDVSTELGSENKRLKLENPLDVTSIVPVHEDILMKTESSSDEETDHPQVIKVVAIDTQSSLDVSKDAVNGSSDVAELKVEKLDDDNNQSDDEKEKTTGNDSKEDDDVKRQKLKEIQQSMALSSFLDNNYEYYYNSNNNIMNDHQSVIACHQSSSQMKNNIEVAVPLKNNLNIRNNNNINNNVNNNESDDGNFRKNRMLMMTIDDDVDIQNANFFNNKLASNYHQPNFEFSGNSDSLINKNINFNDGYSRNEYNTNTTYNQVCESNGTSDYFSQDAAKTSNINFSALDYENINDEKTLLIQNVSDQNIGSELIDNETQTKHVNPDIKMLVTSKSSQYDENYITLHSIALTNDKELEELERALTPELPEFNNGLLSNFNDIDFDVPTPPLGVKIELDLDEQSGLEPTETGQTSSNVDKKQFREWHEVVNVRSYNEELLTILPYVVID